MHRSGTSLVTGSLEAAGLYLGEVNNASTYNRRGNKENESIRDLNDRLLAGAGVAWDAPPEGQVAWSPEDEDRAKSLIAPYLEGKRPWGFKDPRSIWTVEGWLRLVPDTRPIGVFRHPSPVVRSLGARGGSLFVGASDALALWCAYNEELLRLQEKHRFPLLHFDPEGALFASFLSNLASFSESLGLESRSDGFFDPDLLHYTNVEAVESAKAMAIYSRLVATSERTAPEIL